MAQADGRVVIEIGADSSKAQKELTALEKEIKKTEASIAKMQGKRNTLDEQFHRAADAAIKAKTAVKDMETQLEKARAAKEQGFDIPLKEWEKYDNITKQLPQQIAQQEKEAQKLRAEAEKLNAEVEGYNEKLAQSNALLERQTQAAGELSRVVSSGKGDGEDAPKADKSAKESSKRVEKLRAAADGAQESVNRLQQAGAKVGSVVVRGAKSAASAFAAMGRAAVNAFAAAATGIAGFLGKINVFSRLAGSLSGRLARLGTMIKQAFVFNVITQGLNALRNQMGAYLNTNAAFTSALANLQGSLATAFQPIVSAAVPALVTLMNVISSVISVIGRFLAALASIGGHSKSNTKALNAQAGAMGGAGGAAEKASKSLAKFDEINQLSDTSGGGGGGGGGGGMGAEDIPEYEFDSVFDTWGEAFNAFLDTIIQDGLPRLRAALLEFAGWINDLSGNLYEMFTFPGVQEKVRYIGREVAEAFNDMVDEIDWELLGRAMGAGFTTALGLVVSFLYGFDWAELGKSLATALNGLVDEVDWYEFGKLLWAGFKIGLETLAGFLVGLDMPQLAEAASDIVLGFFNSITETVQNIPWEQIGTQIGTFFANIRWAELFEAGKTALLTAVQGILDGLNAFIESAPPELLASIAIAIASTFVGTKVKLIAAFVGIFALLKDKMFEIGATIANAINKIDFASVLTGLGKLLGDAIEGALNLLIGFVETLDWYSLGLELWNGLVGAVESIDWGSVVSKIFELLGAGVAAVGALVVGLAQGIWDSIVSALTATGDYFNSKIEELGAGLIQGVFKGIVDAIRGIGSWINENIFQPFIKGFKSVFGIHSPASSMVGPGADIVGGILKGITQAWSGIVTFFSDKLEGIKKTISTAWSAVKSTAESMWNNITTTLGNAWGNIKTNAGTLFNAARDVIGQAWETIKTNAETTWGNITTNLSTTWNNIKETASNTFQAAKDKIGEAWEAAKSTASTTWDTITTNLGNTWDGIKKAAGEKFDAAKESIVKAWESAQKDGDTTWGLISSSLEGVWNGLNDSAGTIFGWIKDSITGAWRESEKETNLKMKAISKAVGEQSANALKSLNDNFGKAKSAITDPLSSAKSTSEGLGWYGLGSNIVDGISAGVRARAQALANSVANAARNALNAAKSALQIHSPSRVFEREVGIQMGEGMAVGVDESQKSVLSSIRDMAKTVASGFSGAFSLRDMLDGFSSEPFEGLLGVIGQLVEGFHSLIAAMERLRNFRATFSNGIPTPSLPSGSVIPQNREFLTAISVQGGKNNGVSEADIRRIVREEAGGNGNTQILQAILDAVRAGHIITVDRRVLGKVVTQEQNRMTRASGHSALLT